MTRNRPALVAFIDSRANRPHDWTGNCCARFVLGGVEAQFGSAPALAVEWSDLRTARRALAAVGGLEAEADRLFEAIEPAQAQFGDIAGVDHPSEGFLLMIVEGETLVGPGDHGNVRAPRREMVRAWRAGPERVDG